MKHWRKIGRKKAEKNPKIDYPKYIMLSPLMFTLLKRAGAI